LVRLLFLTLLTLTSAPYTSFDVTPYLENLVSKIEDGEAFTSIPAYDPDSEDLPMAKVPVFRPGFAKVQELITLNVIQYMLNAIRIVKMRSPSAELDHMEWRTKKLLLPSFGPPVIIGVRGLAGKGKTSLINALLGIDGLAHTVRNTNHSRNAVRLTCFAEFRRRRDICTGGVLTSG
jgi:hypothetical protein